MGINDREVELIIGKDIWTLILDGVREGMVTAQNMADIASLLKTDPRLSHR